MNIVKIINTNKVRVVYDRVAKQYYMSTYLGTITGWDNFSCISREQVVKRLLDYNADIDPYPILAIVEY